MMAHLEQNRSRPSSGVASPPHRMPSRSRTQSISSDRPSTIAHSFMSPPLSVSPEAAFIAASAASQIVTNDHDSHADTWYDQHGIEPSGETALVSPAALQLVNNFLDQLLFNFLSISRSTTLSALRPAVSEVLKPKLAKDAINQADEELREYLGGDDEDAAQTEEPNSPSDWDLELVWKRTRLRCMVYSSLGDMEEEDEDYHMEQEHLNTELEDRLSEVVSPAVAIFLTSILEFMGEQALVVAGQAAYHRMRVKYEKELKEGARSPADVADRVVVEELDMERVALDRTLGRLWRAWKKKIRSPGPSAMEKALRSSYSRDSMRGPSVHLRSPSSINNMEPVFPAVPAIPEPATESEPEPETESSEGGERQEEMHAQEPVEEHLIAAAIPLPLGDKDVEEIEVPGLVSYSDDEAEAEDTIEQANKTIRPKSLMIFLGSGAAHAPTPTLSQPNTPVFPSRKRSNSLPTPAATPYTEPATRQRVEPIASELNESPATEAEAISDPISTEAVSEDRGAADEVSPFTAASPRAVDSDEATPTEALVVTSSKLDEVVEEDEEEEFIEEEPQILTSSRVSISGPSPTAAERVKPAAINTNLPVRSSSVHSARLIDVTNPRSPVSRSRGSSVDATEHIRQVSLSRPSSIRTPPIVEERQRRSPDSFSASRMSGVHGSKSELTASDSISEAEEVAYNDDGVSPLTPAVTGLAIIPEPASTDHQYRQTQSDVYSSQPIFGSAVRHGSTPSSPAKPTTTKVTILASSTPSGSFFIDDGEDRPEVPEKTPVDDGAAMPPPPNVPERSPGRQGSINTPSQSQPSTIGLVSVERVRTRSPSEPVSLRQQQMSGSPSTSSIKKKAVRTSEESAHAQTSADMARNFEELIQSDQTIQYTLTPEGMRDFDTQSMRSIATGSPLMPVKSRKSEDARQNGDRSRSSSVVNRPNDMKRSGSVSQSISDAQRNSNNSSNSGSTSKPSGLIPRSTPAMQAQHRGNGPQPRDARLPRESLADFAEFIRSTGPAGASLTPAASSRMPGPSSLRSPSGPIPVSKTSIESGRTSTTSNRLRLQARAAAVDKDDNSDLIDFIRRGPPTTSGNPRIPRTVAPFRTTMDSDQMSGAVGGKAVDAQIRDVDVRSSQASTNYTDYSMPSVHSSVNSQSALLGRNKPLPGGNSRFGTMGNDDMPMPQRKTRRVRDPYAIDLTDEEELDEDESTPRPSRRAPTQEESLMDFLNNVPPPPEPVVRPFVNTQAQNLPKKKASAPSLMARFARRDSLQGGLGSMGPKSPKSPKKPSTAVESRRSLSSRASGGGRGYIPIQVNMPPGADKYAPGFGGPTSRVPGSMGSGSSGGFTASTGRVPMKRFEPREAVSIPVRSGTSDLADFLKNSEPPPNMLASSALQRGEAANGGAFSKVFARRKKANVA
ncbi:hypothetical protein QBC46DRAFT_106630 [Diplogelasinospora grovesii]|uniref:Uncharacterized protein n=1 Tax=Diplogelasinospora grovesii TaxID=303347 RepID=A0AAN6N9P3_9PEZI|nr:hypothetical protein QBC46DRAFT_106630 [Diplogelasinospora grovesii]